MRYVFDLNTIIDDSRRYDTTYLTEILELEVNWNQHVSINFKPILNNTGFELIIGFTGPLKYQTFLNSDKLQTLLSETITMAKLRRLILRDDVTTWKTLIIDTVQNWISGYIAKVISTAKLITNSPIMRINMIIFWAIVNGNNDKTFNNDTFLFDAMIKNDESPNDIADIFIKIGEGHVSLSTLFSLGKVGINTFYIITDRTYNKITYNSSYDIEFDLEIDYKNVWSSNNDLTGLTRHFNDKLMYPAWHYVHTFDVPHCHIFKSLEHFNTYYLISIFKTIKNLISASLGKQTSMTRIFDVPLTEGIYSTVHKKYLYAQDWVYTINTLNQLPKTLKELDASLTLYYQRIIDSGMFKNVLFSGKLILLQEYYYRLKELVSNSNYELDHLDQVILYNPTTFHANPLSSESDINKLIIKELIPFGAPLSAALIANIQGGRAEVTKIIDQIGFVRTNFDINYGYLIRGSFPDSNYIDEVMVENSDDFTKFQSLWNDNGRKLFDAKYRNDVYKTFMSNEFFNSLLSIDNLKQIKPFSKISAIIYYYLATSNVPIVDTAFNFTKINSINIKEITSEEFDLMMAIGSSLDGILAKYDRTNSTVIQNYTYFGTKKRIIVETEFNTDVPKWLNQAFRQRLEFENIPRTSLVVDAIGVEFVPITHNFNIIFLDFVFSIGIIDSAVSTKWINRFKYWYSQTPDIILLRLPIITDEFITELYNVLNDTSYKVYIFPTWNNSIWFRTPIIAITKTFLPLGDTNIFADDINTESEFREIVGASTMKSSLINNVTIKNKLINVKDLLTVDKPWTNLFANGNPILVGTVVLGFEGILMSTLANLVRRVIGYFSGKSSQRIFSMFGVVDRRNKMLCDRLSFLNGITKEVRITPVSNDDVLRISDLSRIQIGMGNYLVNLNRMYYEMIYQYLLSINNDNTGFDVLDIGGRAHEGIVFTCSKDTWYINKDPALAGLGGNIFNKVIIDSTALPITATVSDLNNMFQSNIAPKILVMLNSVGMLSDIDQIEDYFKLGIRWQSQTDGIKRYFIWSSYNDTNVNLLFYLYDKINTLYSTSDNVKYIKVGTYDKVPMISKTILEQWNTEVSGIGTFKYIRGSLRDYNLVNLQNLFGIVTTDGLRAVSMNEIVNYLIVTPT